MLNVLPCRPLLQPPPTAVVPPIATMPPKPSRLTQIEGGLPAEYSSPKAAGWLRRLSFPEDELQFDVDEDLQAPLPLKYAAAKPSASAAPGQPHPLANSQDQAQCTSGLSPVSYTHLTLPTTPYV